MLKTTNVSQYFECKVIIDNKCKIKCEDQMPKM